MNSPCRQRKPHTPSSDRPTNRTEPGDPNRFEGCPDLGPEKQASDVPGGRRTRPWRQDSSPLPVGWSGCTVPRTVSSDFLRPDQTTELGGKAPNPGLVRALDLESR